MRALLVLVVVPVLGCAHHPSQCGALPPGHPAVHGWSAGLMQGEAEPHGHTSLANAHMHSSDFATLVARFEDPGRDAWQKPDALLATLALEGKVVADLGAGTGYFSVRLAEKAKQVIATDVDERFLAYLRGRASMLAPALRDKLVLRRVGTDRPGLTPEEAELVLVVDVYHHVDQRLEWLRALAAGMKPGGELVVVDFKAGAIEDAPPPELRVAVATVLAELKAAGFEAPQVDEALLPRQFVVRVRVPVAP